MSLTEKIPNCIATPFLDPATISDTCARIQSAARGLVTRARARLFGSAHANCGGREVLVDELHGHRSFAHGGGTAFGRAGADVAGREDAGNARLEQVVGAGRIAGKDEPVGGARNGVVEPLRARLRAEEEEEERERHLLAALERDRLEAPVRSVE